MHLYDHHVNELGAVTLHYNSKYGPPFKALVRTIYIQLIGRTF